MPCPIHCLSMHACLFETGATGDCCEEGGRTMYLSGRVDAVRTALVQKKKAQPDSELGEEDVLLLYIALGM